MTEKNDGDSALKAADKAKTTSTSSLRDHDDRIVLNNEVHARPYERLAAPVRASYIALLSGVESADEERKCIEDLCQRYNVNRPSTGSNHFTADFGNFRLRWERHTEFSAYTILHSGAFDAPFDDLPLKRVPEAWLSSLPGEVLIAVHVAIEPADSEVRDYEALGDLFVPGSLVGSRVSGAAAIAWTDFQIHADGFSRMLVHDSGLGARQAGRLVQRLLEIETYRMMALLALPPARKYTPELFRLDKQVAELSDTLTQEMRLEDEQRLLEGLTRLSAEVERISAATGFRFGAARAYYDIVRQRISELREERHEKLQTFGEFMQRRLTPAMQTCDSVNKRIEGLTARVARVSDLLQTRVNIAMERQSRDLLESMNRRAHLQIRLQETVEGLSVVVLSYYLVGLVNYGLKGLKSSGVSLDVDILTGIAIVPVVAVVLLGVRRLRRKVTREVEKT
ncbi:MAG: DUF3422 domain-containing protein [Gammaproteobacteria bacterium]|nr:DUF3422 domain-containing protein [Gammaproteobacteria bacterium]